MFRLRDISEDTTLFPWNKSTPQPALASTVPVAVALLLGEFTGHASAGSIAAGAAFTVGFAIFHEAMASTLLSMFLATLGIASATLAGSLGAQWTPVVLVLCVVAAVNYGLLAGIGNTSGWIGQQCAVFVIVSSYFAQGVHYALGRSSMVLLGGGLQMLTFYLWNLFKHHERHGDAPAPPVLRQMRTRSGQLWRTGRDLLHWRTDTTAYVLKLLVTLSVTTLFYRELHWRNGYWAPMTALLVLKPKWANTLSRGVARLAGTMVAVGICALLTLHPVFNHWAYFLIILGSAWICFALQAVNYALFCLALTLYTVFLFAFGGFSERTAADLRLINTAAGGLLALAVDFVAKYVMPRLFRLPTGTDPGDSEILKPTSH